MERFLKQGLHFPQRWDPGQHGNAMHKMCLTRGLREAVESCAAKSRAPRLLVLDSPEAEEFTGL